MKKKSTLFFALFAALVSGVLNVQAQTSKAGGDSALLYEISGKDLKKPSYLFGTIHMVCRKDMTFNEKLIDYLGRNEQLMLEINFTDPAEMQAAAKGAIMADGKKMKDSLKAEEYAKVDEVFKNYLGVSYDRLQTLKAPMAATLLLTSPKGFGCETSPGGYDAFLAKTAAANKLPVSGLETAASQLAALDAQPFDRQIEQLNRLAANPEKSFADFRQVYQKYLAQNPDKLYKAVAEQFKADGMPQGALIDDRNAAWISVIEKNIQSKPSFIGVGAGHLGGKKGVLKLLRKKGYKLTPIKL